MATALLVVDVQQLLVDGLELSRRNDLLNTLSSMIARARESAIPVVYIQHEDEEFVPGTPAWEIATEIAPKPGEPVVGKRYRDAFRETNLAATLERLGIDHIVACGMQTEFCVDATIREAERRGYRVTLVSDGHATFAVDGASEQQIIDQVHRVAAGRVAQIVPSAEIFTTSRV